MSRIARIRGTPDDTISNKKCPTKACNWPLTKAQIESLIKKDIVQLELFDEEINEVIIEDGKRYIMKRNPVRAEEIAASRKSKLQSLLDFIAIAPRSLEKGGDYVKSTLMKAFVETL